MEEKIIELGTYCVEHDISLEDLKQIRKELQDEKLKSDALHNEHFQKFLDVKNKQLISGNLKIDFFQNQVKKGNKLISIHESELLILQMMMANSRKTIKDEEILELLKNYGYDIGFKSMIVYISRITHKIGGNYIKRHWKQGYYWNIKVTIQE